MFEVNVRTMDSLAVVVRWSILMLIGVSWHVNSQTVQQTTEVDNSYNFYYEQPCCSGTVTKSKYHMRHRRDHVREFSCGTLYYRTFFVDSKRDALYVGAMDRLYRLNMNNISASHCERDSINLEPSNVAQCVSKGKSEHFDCRNHVRVIQPMGDGSRLYVCGTNAHSPKDWVLYSNLTHLPRHEYVPGIGMGVAKCPYDPADNSTALWVERGNPGSLPALYSGTNAEFTKADTVIFRTDLHNLTTGRREFAFKRTLKYDSKWLDKPNFVGSFDVGDYVLFFFRETAVEYINCGKAVYSRVARVCKKDTGGKNILSQNWATYLKARLNCSIPGEFPFYFNEIQSIYKVPGDDSRFYGVFTTASTGLMGSAICTFTIGDIQKAFEGKFKEQASSSSAWLPVISSKVPEPRPGTCVNDTASLPDTVLNFIRSHPLMDSAVSHENEKPIYYKRDLFFTRLVVDKVKVDMMGHPLEYTVYYAGTNEGKIHKIVQWNRNGDSQSALLDIFDVTPGEPIQAMAISRMHGSLYAASDRRVLQLRLALCARRYDACVRCARDPYCGWDRDAGVCREYMPGLIQDVANETADICDSSIARKSVSATWGQSLHLGSFVKMPEVLQPRAVTWYHYSREKGRHPITFNKPEKYIETSEHGLLIISVNEADAGRYDCWLGGSLLCSYNITVDTHRCSPPEKSNEYQKIYSNWCHEFEKYKTAMKTWERKQEQCSRQNDSNQNTHPNEIV
ncbi:semaphorin-2A isoform X3 [Spodoptera frugiperda]|uniref:Semaphorin-2A n=3 Tax=Noctuidae TaxID=7100 RepID=A0A9R0DMX7_SPOFR|nr:semaphorin-2A isoform X1 [Spodoptera frugiperda]XP_050550356.1 semaphorin-2A isoform X2 [Spodoptera frugiperda]XP_050550357.1 semaphorin-2A isoform X3 [Spodoptera frugiperda]